MKKYIWIGIGIAGLVVLLGRDGSVEQVADPVAEEGCQPDIVLEASADAESAVVESELVGTNDSEPEVSDAVMVLIDPETSYKDRLKAMRQLGYELGQKDIDALMEFMALPLGQDSRLSPIAYNSIRNDAFEILLRQHELPEGMGDLLVSVYNDPAHDDMWRNYCIQFMQPLYERQAEELGSKVEGLTTEDDTEVVPPNAPHGRSVDQLDMIQDTLWGALDERDNSNAGTALLALDKLSRDHAAFDQEQIRAAMVNLAEDTEATLANRVTALRLCGEQGSADALETARNLARHGDTTMLRCAAIATLGEIGGEEDMALLEAYSKSRDKRIADIARMTLERM